MEQRAWSGSHFQWDVSAVVLRVRTKGARLKVPRPVWELTGQTIQVRKDRDLGQVVIEREDFRSGFDRTER